MAAGRSAVSQATSDGVTSPWFLRSNRRRLPWLGVGAANLLALAAGRDVHCVPPRKDWRDQGEVAASHDQKHWYKHPARAGLRRTNKVCFKKRLAG